VKVKARNVQQEKRIMRADATVRKLAVCSNGVLGCDAERVAMPPIVRLQVVITPQILEAIDGRVARLQQLFPGATVSRSSVARDLLEVGFPHAEESLSAMEDARTTVRLPITIPRDSGTTTCLIPVT
jgi:hypothetical protein